ncbi:MAG: ABC-2 family transporter protein, partial [Cyanobacteria bacterium J06649_5]
RQLGLTPLAYLAMLPPLALGVVSLYSIWFMLGATSIWFVKIYNVTEVLRSLLEAGRFPVEGYPAVYRVFFTFIIPVAFLTTVPAQAMLGRSEPIWLLGSALLAAALFQASRAFWRFALRFYTSASS